MIVSSKKTGSYPTPLFLPTYLSEQDYFRVDLCLGRLTDKELERFIESSIKKREPDWKSDNFVCRFYTGMQKKRQNLNLHYWIACQDEKKLPEMCIRKDDLNLKQLLKVSILACLFFLIHQGKIDILQTFIITNCQHIQFPKSPHIIAGEKIPPESGFFYLPPALDLSAKLAKISLNLSVSNVCKKRLKLKDLWLPSLTLP